MIEEIIKWSEAGIIQRYIKLQAILFRIEKMKNNLSRVSLISGAVQTGRSDYVAALIAQALESGVPAEQILNEGLLEGMRRLGAKFRRNEVYVPEVLVAARALNRGMELLRPGLIKEGVKPIGKVLLATVKGDMHDVGKNLVRMMMEGGGLEVLDIGVNIDAAEIVEAVRVHRPQVVALSALLTATMDHQRIVIEALMDAGLRSSVKVLVGGAPVTQAFCDLIGADGYAPDAASAAELVKRMLGVGRPSGEAVTRASEYDILQKNACGRMT